MFLPRKLKKIACIVSAFALLALQMSPLQAALVSTPDVFHEAEILSPLQHELIGMVETQALVTQLEQLGVSPEAARQRIANMTDQEIAALQEHMDSMPAGGIDIILAALIVFLILLATDIAGLTDIFPFVKK